MEPPDRAPTEPGGSEIPHATADLWVFGYGSLMWRPGFSYREAHPALVRGWHRSLCVYSHHHRGTPERPGLVLGLDRGGSCRGVAFRVGANEAHDVRAYLIAREQVTMVYREVAVHARLDDGRRVRALSFVVDRAHHQYAGVLDIRSQANLIRTAEGVSGANIDYVANTLSHLAEIAVEDKGLLALGRALGFERARAEPAPSAMPGDF